MFRTYVLPALAVVLAAFALGYALYSQRPDPDTPPPLPPTSSPFGETVAGLGMVEPSTEASGTGNIAVGSQVAGVVVAVRARIGQAVKAGDLLVELDARQAEADLGFRCTALEVAQEQLRRLELQPRPEEVPVAEAQARAAEASMKQARDQWERARDAGPGGGVSRQQLVAAQQAYLTARAQAELAKANLALLKAGAWAPDKAVAAANVEQARAQVDQAETALALLQVRAPVDGAVLQVNIRPGEYVSTQGGQSLVLMGSLRPLHVRVNVDQEDLPRLKLAAPARAKVRGDPKQEELPLTFVRLEPYVVPKASLTGANIERVDTRVVQLIYAASPEHPLVRERKVLVGQLLDVFIDTRAAPSSSCPTGGK